MGYAGAIPDDLVEQQLDRGYEAAEQAFAADRSTGHKPYGQTSPDLYAYTYWWVKGFNTYVEEQAAP